MDQNRTIPDNAEAQALRAMATRYRRASGVAYAAGDDDKASLYRKTAEEIDGLARVVATLPEIPATTRGV